MNPPDAASPPKLLATRCRRVLPLSPAAGPKLSRPGQDEPTTRGLTNPPMQTRLSVGSVAPDPAGRPADPSPPPACTAWRPTSKAALVYEAGDCSRRKRQGSCPVVPPGGGPDRFVGVQPSGQGTVIPSQLNAEYQDRVDEGTCRRALVEGSEGCLGSDRPVQKVPQIQ